MDRRELDGTKIASAMCNPCLYDGDCEQCKKDTEEFYGHEITIKCVLCGNDWTVSKDDANYAHRYGINASLPICPECKKAIKFVKWFLQKHPIRLNYEKGFIHEVPLKIKTGHVDEYYGAVARCPSCDSSWIMGDDEVLHYCPSCGKAVKWE